MTMTWVLVADDSSAKIYACPKAKLLDGNGELTLVKECPHTEGRKQNHELGSDRSGRYAVSTSSARGVYEGADPHEHEKEVFAKQLAEILNEGRVSQAYEELILVVPPHFHGVLTKCLDKHVHAMLDKVINKDYTKFDTKKLFEHLQEHL